MAERVAFLPETPEELTPEWLSEVLGGEVTDLSYSALGDGIGFMGDVLLLNLISKDAAIPSQIVAKLPKKANRVMGELLGVYEREIMFFREVGEQVPLRIPITYYSEFDRDAGSEKQGEILEQIDKMPLFLNKVISVLGNFIAARKKRRYMLLIEYLDGYQPGDQLAGLGVDGCQQVLREIAQLHSKFWETNEIKGYFWLVDMAVDARIRHGMFNQHSADYKFKMPERVTPLIEWLEEHGARFLKEYPTLTPTTLLHCDLRLDNVLFSDSGCAFIDWQLTRAGPAAFDVAYFVTSALDVQATDEEVMQLLHVYHEALRQDGYTFDTFFDDYCRGLMQVLSNLSSVDDVDLGDGRGSKMMQAWLDRLAARLSMVDTERLLRNPDLMAQK
ncbi:MAG: phosphotransferase [Pseudomonadota bacterium]